MERVRNLPYDDSKAKKSSDNAKGHCDDAAWREASRQWVGRSVCAVQIEKINGVSSGISSVWHVTCRTSVDVVLRNSQRLLDFQWSLYHCSDQPLVNMPFDMAME